jgi:prepilin-type N-terminal cleavage/methylation domain-containing protein
MIIRARMRSQRGVTLVELLVAMTIMAVLSTMIIGTWVALTDAYSFTSRSDKQRDLARQAIDRMAREIRDAQEPMVSPHRAFAAARADEVRFFSTFNTSGAPDPSSQPRLTRFIYRITDAATGVGTVYREFPGPDGIFDNGNDVSQPLITDVSNAHNGKDIFTYYSYDSGGSLIPSDGEDELVDPSRIVTVGITLLVDLNPGKAPNYMDISTVVQPRNVREF